MKTLTTVISEAEQIGLSLTRSQTPEDRFSRDVAQIKYSYASITTYTMHATMLGISIA